MNKKQITLVCFHCGTKTKHKIDTDRPTIANCKKCGAETESHHGAFGEDP